MIVGPDGLWLAIQIKVSARVSAWGVRGSAFASAFGWKLILAIFLVHHMLNGVGGVLVYHATELTYRDLKVDGPTMQVLSSVARLPYSMKALMGLVSDGFPLCGRRKGPYLFLASLVAICAYLFLSTSEHPSANGSTASFFVIFFHMCLSDLLVQSKYSEKVKANPEFGPDLLTFASAGMSCFMMLSTILSGWMLQNFGAKPCYLLSLPFAALVLWTASCNHLEEMAPPDMQVCRPDSRIWRGKAKVTFIVALVSGFSAIVMLVCTLLLSTVMAKFLAAVFLGLTNLAVISFFLNPVIAKINAYFFLHAAFHIGTYGPAFYFFTDTEEQYPEGPHFSYQFYVTVMGFVASMFGLLGTFCYSVCARHWKYRSILTTTSLAYAVVNCLSVIAYKRINVKYGISDKPFLLVSNALQTVLGQLAWMPMSVMLSQLVPKGIESVMFALLSASLSFGYQVANYAGALVLTELGVTPNGSVQETAKFENLWLAALCSAGGTLIPITLVNVFIPEGRQTDRLLDEKEGGLDSATAGSLFEKTWPYALTTDDGIDDANLLPTAAHGGPAADGVQLESMTAPQPQKTPLWQQN